ncbi:C40 family peptidase [Rhodococcus kronopolitis]|uniref:C40 family peptidase n=1 Tax=Rhodococcus kronopolitis TaxID=1460226 RepID=A0ABV9FUI8_9NOCA
MTPTTAADRRRNRVRTALGVTGLAVLTAGAVLIPPALARSTTDELGRLTAAETEVADTVESTDTEVTVPVWTPESSPSSSPAGLVALAAAHTQAGKEYQWGGTGPDEWDCSGLVQWAFGTAGVELPRVSEDQALVGAEVPVADMAPGDVITFRDAADHIGIYAGSGQVFNAYDEGVPIGLTPLADLPPIHNVQRF